MSLFGFQTQLLRLVMDERFRRLVLTKGSAALPPGLTPLENRRLLRAAGDRGLDMTRAMYEGFRMSKVKRTLPLTCALLGKKRLPRLLQEYWQAHPPTSFYYVDEARAFVGYLTNQLACGILRGRYLREVLEFETLNLQLLETIANGNHTSPTLTARFTHDPIELLVGLNRGEVPTAPIKGRFTLLGTIVKGQPNWTVADDSYWSG